MGRNIGILYHTKFSYSQSQHHITWKASSILMILKPLIYVNHSAAVLLPAEDIIFNRQIFLVNILFPSLHGVR